MQASIAPTFRSLRALFQTIRALLAENRLAEAVSVYSQCHDDVGWRLISELEDEPALQQQCAIMLDRARDYEKAAQLYAQLEQFDKAASLYERASNHAAAAELYARIGQVERAAVMYEKYGSYQIAADLFLECGEQRLAARNYERAGKHYLAGKLFYEAGVYERAMQLLQRVEKAEPNFQDAIEHVALVLVKTGSAARGIRRLQSVLSDQAVSTENLPLYRRLAEMMDQWGDADEAIRVYEMVLAFEVENRAISARLEQLKNQNPDENAPTLLWDEPTVSASGEIEHRVVGVLEDFDFLRDIPLFEELSLEEMKAFFGLCIPSRYRAGEVLIAQGGRGVSMHILRSGQLEVQRVNGDEVIPLARLSAGNFVGEMSLVDSAPTSARVVAQTECVTLQIRRVDFERLLLSDDRLALRVHRAFVRTLSTRLRKTMAKLSAS